MVINSNDGGREFLCSEIIKNLHSVDNREKTLIVNGRYFMYQNKTVYVELSNKNLLEFFIRIKKDDSSVGKEYVTDIIIDKLYGNVISPKLGSFVYDGSVTPKKVRIYVDSSLDFLIIEGTLYHIARAAIKRNSSRPMLEDDDIRLNVSELRALMAAFKQISYDNYYHFMFNSAQKRVLNRCYKKKKFFSIMHAFIPVLISYKYVYNPLIDDPSDTIFRRSKLLETAIVNKRRVDVNDKLFCYMLTHEEICRSFGLSKFMRFTPEFLYKYLVGLLKPELLSFPNKIRKIYVRPATGEEFSGYSTTYSETDYQKLLDDLASKITDDMSDDEKSAINKELLVLNSYANIDTLYYEIERVRHKLVTIGATQLDTKISTDQLYDILLEGSLLFGGQVNGEI